VRWRGPCNPTGSDAGKGSDRRAACFPAFLLLLLSGLLFLICGCKNEKNHLSPAQVHAITREMLRAAGGSGKNIGVSSRLRFDGVDTRRDDQLVFTFSSAPSEQSRQERVTQLIQSLDRVGTAHNLSRDAEASSGALLVLNYQRSGVLTQSVHIIAPIVARAAAAQTSLLAGHARLAIILDDLGSDRAAADQVFALAYPLTVSVLPGHAHSAEIAEEAHRRGYEVMLHLPMQSVANEAPEPQELRPGMPADDIPVLFEQMMQSVPNADGVNNHQGSRATADPALMQELMPVLQQWNLFYVDSRTSAATVAYDIAQHAGVRSAFRNAPFLDDVAEVPAVRKQLELAFRKAQEKGEAITIGHAHAATLQALREQLPRASAAGVQLVHVSELVH
jgi:polysaccharide deacetylase 2 family uncharacterized protein YibQ